MSSTHSHYDVVIVGGGVSGTALFFALSKYTDIKRIALIEKYKQRGQVNSKSTNNSQTLHFGDIETNYSLEKATKVKHKSDMVKHLVHTMGKEFPDRQLYSIYNKMVIAVGAKQVAELEKRYESFKTLFPSLVKIGAKEIAQLEPNVMKGRDPNQPIIALSSPEGYTIDYGLLAQTMVESAQINNTDRILHTMLDTKLKIITRSRSGYHLVTQQGEKTLEIDATMVVVSAGGHTPLVAQSLGYGKHFSILSVAGSFFRSNHHLLNGKVYTMQIPKLPFAAVHGDPDVHHTHETRFGPTAKGIFMLERYNYSSIGEYFKVFGFRIKSFLIILQLMFDRVIGRYLFVNFWYDIPRIGKRLFIRELKTIIPTITHRDIEHGYRLGGTRPQILNLDTMKLEMGEAKITGDQIIFNITPSPGASTCLGNAYEDTQTLIKRFDGVYTFDQKKRIEEYGG